MRGKTMSDPRGPIKNVGLYSYISEEMCACVRGDGIGRFGRSTCTFNALDSSRGSMS